MNKVFIDTNILIDFLGEREPFYEAAARIVSRADRKEIELQVSSLSYATASYSQKEMVCELDKRNLRVRSDSNSSL